MYTITYRHISTRALYLFEGWSSDSFNKGVDSSGVKTIDQLSKAQQNVVNQILQELDENPEIWIQVGLELKDIYNTITHNPEKLKTLLGVIEQTKQAKLNEITDQYNSWEIARWAAKNLAHNTIIHYSHLAQKSFQDSFSSSWEIA